MTLTLAHLEFQQSAKLMNCGQVVTRPHMNETAMQIEMFTGKLHQGTVTQCDLTYQGSISIDADLLEASGILPYQKVDIYNINNGARFSTYTIPTRSGSKTIGLNGAAARLAQVGDRVIIVAFGYFEREEIRDHQPKVILLNEKNEIVGQGH